MRGFVRYMLMPGDVISRYDGQRHRISGGQLRRLYGFPRPAHIARPWEAPPNWVPPGSSDERVNRFFAAWWPWVVPLAPRVDGDYSLASAVRRWAPFALTAFRERLLHTEARLAVSLQRAADLGQKIADFESRRRVSR